MKPANQRGQAGYNLVETLVAVAMTGVVILSIMTLFFMGRKNVYSGKQMTAANAVATRVLEDLSMMSAQDIRDNFGLDDDTVLADHTINGVTYPDAVLRTTATITAETDPSDYLDRWQDLLPSTAFDSARVTLVITPTEILDEDEPVSTAQVIRVRGMVQWNEGSRQRFVTFDASKLQRP